MTQEQKTLFKHSPHLFKLRFIYRKFHFEFKPLSKANEYLPKVDLPNITAFPHVLGLILTYHINYGLPLRELVCCASYIPTHHPRQFHQAFLPPAVKGLIFHGLFDATDLCAIAAYHMDLLGTSLEQARNALNYAPDNERLKNNLIIIGYAMKMHKS